MTANLYKSRASEYFATTDTQHQAVTQTNEALSQSINNVFFEGGDCDEGIFVQCHCNTEIDSLYQFCLTNGKQVSSTLKVQQLWTSQRLLLLHFVVILHKFALYYEISNTLLPSFDLVSTKHSTKVHILQGCCIGLVKCLEYYKYYCMYLGYFDLT